MHSLWYPKFCLPRIFLYFSVNDSDAATIVEEAAQQEPDSSLVDELPDNLFDLALNMADEMEDFQKPLGEMSREITSSIQDDASTDVEKFSESQPQDEVEQRSSTPVPSEESPSNSKKGKKNMQPSKWMLSCRIGFYLPIL